MPSGSSRMRALSVSIGAAVFVGVVYSVFRIDWTQEPVEEPPIIRPVKSTVVGYGTVETDIRFPGRVSAVRSVNLAFDVAGQVIERTANKGMAVQEGDVLARLDDSDYRNDLRVARAEMQRTRAQFERVQQAAESDAVSQQDLSNAQAAFEAAEAQVQIREKALSETELRAPFSGLIGTTFVENFQTVQAKEAVLSLQDMSSIEVDIDVPEQRVLAAPQGDEPRSDLFVEFDYLPDQRFPAQLVNVAADADPVTQTFAATVGLPTPDDENILPGMSASVVVELREEARDATDIITVPVEALAVDESDRFYVWRLKESGDGIHVVERVDVEQGRLGAREAQVTSGLTAGDRIATAGVNFLRQGQRVKLLESGS